jgi:hypothetical protein
MTRALVLSVTLVAALISTGCTMVAPHYSPSLDNVQKLKDGNIQPTQVTPFTSEPGKGNANPISIRGSSLNSPYGGSYANYLTEALKHELTLANKISSDSQVKVSGAIRKNDISAAGASKASGDIEARFVVNRGGTVTYDQVKSIHDEWDSSFVGSVAIPRAQARYPVMVQKLLAALFADPAFIEALK